MDQKRRDAGLDEISLAELFNLEKMLTGIDPKSGILDMRIWFARIAFEARLKGINLISNHE